jgi:signal transduction histidine kinase
MSYTPYVAGALTGIWSALWIWRVLPFEYGPISANWRWTILGVGTGTWLTVGVLSNHLANIVDRRREYEKGLEGLMESRQRIMMIHEETRKEVAGLLHGRVQSRLVVLGHWLKDCEGQLKENNGQALSSLEEANKLLREIRDQELRAITRQLYPSIIRTGLPSALNSLADRFRSMFSIDVHVDKAMSELDSPMNPRLGESLRLTLYRVAEEALSNVAKHAQAGEVWVSLGLSHDTDIVLVVRDNGRGFDRSTARVGQGLLSIDDYVMALGGNVQVTSAAGAGTVVVVTVPAFAGQPARRSDHAHSKAIEPFLPSR